MSRFVRFAQAGTAAWGRLAGETVQPLDAAPWEQGQDQGEPRPLAGLSLLAPATPSKILCVGLNYRSHLQGRLAPERPELFFKPPSALVGPGAAIVFPPGATEVHFEGELVVVIGRSAHRVAPEQALAHVFGYTIGNDVSERAWQQGDRQWWRAKGSDTFAPLGPWLVTELDLVGATLTTTLDGVVKQAGVLDDLLFDVATVISFASQHLTLLPGDLIYTGTPGATCRMAPGQVVEVAIAGIGTLRNPVA